MELWRRIKEDKRMLVSTKGRGKEDIQTLQKGCFCGKYKQRDAKRQNKYL